MKTQYMGIIAAAISILVVISIIIFIFETSPSEPMGNLSVVFSKYEDKSLGFKIDYPESWIVKQPESSSSVYFTTHDVSDEEQRNLPAFVILHEPINEEYPNANAYAISYLDNLNDVSFVEQIDHTMTHATLSGMNATVIEIKVTTNDDEIQSMIYYIDSRDMVYIIGYTSPVSAYGENLDIAKEMFLSFRLI